MIRTWVSLLLVGALMAGCGEDDESSPSVASDADSVSRAFLTAIAEDNGDAACELVTSSAVEEFEMLTGETGCAAAVAARPGLLSLGEFTVRSQALQTALERDDLEPVSGTDRFKLELPGGAELTISLLESDEGWRVNSMLLGRTVSCGAGEVC